MTDPKTFDELVREGYQPADIVAHAIFTGQWFPPDPRDVESDEAGD